MIPRSSWYLVVSGVLFFIYFTNEVLKKKASVLGQNIYSPHESEVAGAGEGEKAGVGLLFQKVKCKKEEEEEEILVIPQRESLKPLSVKGCCLALGY